MQFRELVSPVKTVLASLTWAVSASCVRPPLPSSAKRERGKRVQHKRKERNFNSLEDIEDFAQKLKKRRNAGTTEASYQVAQHFYQKLCDSTGLQAYPVTIRSICTFASHLAMEGYALKTMKSYVAAVKFEDLERGDEGGQGKAFDARQLESIMKGFQRITRETGQVQHRKHAISFRNLKRLANLWDTDKLIDIRDRAAILLGFFGILRVSEYMYKKQRDESEIKDLQWRNVKFYKNGMTVRIGLAKTDKTGAGQLIVVGRRTKENGRYCPVRALKKWKRECKRQKKREWQRSDSIFLSIYESKQGQIVRTTKGKYARQTADSFRNRLRQGLISVMGDAAKQYATHSLRSGGATEMMAAGVDPTKVKAMGRWRSEAYLEYRRMKAHELTGIVNAIGG